MNQEHLTNEQLIDYLHGELAPGEDATILQHLQHCQTCSVAYDAQARLSEMLRGYARTTERELPQGVVNTIWDRIENDGQAQPGWITSIAALWRPAFAVPAAAVIVVAAFFGYSATRTTPVTTIDASYYLQDHAALTGTVPFNEGVIVPSSLKDEDNMTAALREPQGDNGAWGAVR